MAKDRETPCLYYICMSECKKDRDANHWHYCQNVISINQEQECDI